MTIKSYIALKIFNLLKDKLENNILQYQVCQNCNKIQKELNIIYIKSQNGHKSKLYCDDCYQQYIKYQYGNPDK